MNKSRRLRSMLLTRFDELVEDLDNLNENLAAAQNELQNELKKLDYLLKESAATLFGHERGPNHSERVTANAKALDDAHDEIEKCNKVLFQFKLKHGDIE